ncbi:MAG: 3'-5' exonuclease [Planctomycetota bacterium]|jgi:DNA polymerase-3 subunit epsilon|nr:3'-5' exonuclease [Planctomycetota bacterium]
MDAMILQLDRPIVFLDLETTGLDIENDRIVEIGLIKIHTDGQREELVERIDPGIDIPEAAAKVHGIRTEDVRGLFGKPRLDKIGDALLAFLENADLGGFNSIRFDVPLWERECERHGIAFDMTGRLQVDSQIIFHAKETNWDRFLMGPRNLSAAVRLYCGRDLDGAHSAAADATASADVLISQLERYEDLPRDCQGLHDWCARGIEERKARTAGAGN